MPHVILHGPFVWNGAGDEIPPGATHGYWIGPVANGGTITVTAHGLKFVTEPSMLEVVGTSIRAAGDNVSYVDFSVRNNSSHGAPYVRVHVAVIVP